MTEGAHRRVARSHRAREHVEVVGELLLERLRIFETRRLTMNRVTNGAARPASRPQSDWSQAATTSDVRIPPTIVQPMIASGELEAPEIDVGLEPLPPALIADRALRCRRASR